MPQNQLLGDLILEMRLVAVSAGTHVGGSHAGAHSKVKATQAGRDQDPPGTRTQFLPGLLILLLIGTLTKWCLVRRLLCCSSQMGGLGLSRGFQRLRGHWAL